MQHETKIIFLAEYTHGGDADPKDWIIRCLQDAKKGELIFGYNLVHVFPSILTTKIIFEFSTAIVIPETDDSNWMDQYDLAIKEGKIIGDAITNDTDVEIRGARILQG